MLRSGNDAAIAIAYDVAGSVPAFVDALNALPRRIGLAATRFADPHGLGADAYTASSISYSG